MTHWIVKCQKVDRIFYVGPNGREVDHPDQAQRFDHWRDAGKVRYEQVRAGNLSVIKQVSD